AFSLRRSWVTRPPRPSPYPLPLTTLFRSVHMALAAVIVAGVAVHAVLIEGAMETVSKLALCALVVAAATTVMAGLRSRKRAPARDRKSTRLNSSHVKISYAAFCLEKKTDL